MISIHTILAHILLFQQIWVVNKQKALFFFLTSVGWKRQVTKFWHIAVISTAVHTTIFFLRMHGTQTRERTIKYKKDKKGRNIYKHTKALNIHDGGFSNTCKHAHTCAAWTKKKNTWAMCKWVAVVLARARSLLCEKKETFIYKALH